MEEDGNFPRARQAFAVDALATIFGSVFGLSPVTSYIESAAGVGVGARTGLTAVFVGFFFFLSVFFAPIIASIPPWATGGALIIVGSMMARSLAKIKWHDVTHATTAFITVMVMPLTYSIAYGLIAGIGTWLVLQSVFLLFSLVGIEKPVFSLDSIHVVEVKEMERSGGKQVDEQNKLDIGESSEEVQEETPAEKDLEEDLEEPSS